MGQGAGAAPRRLASLSFEAFSTLVKAPRITPSQRQKKLLLAEQGGKCAACGQQIGAGCAEFDHIVPVRQAFAGRFQALCFECHQMKTQTESMQPTSLESRFTRSVYDAYVRSPKQPPLVFQARAPGSGPLEGVDVVRCRRNGLANAPFPLPIFCPADNIEPARPGHLADLSFVDLQNRGRDAPVTLLPYVGPGWYPKVSLDYMLRCGVAQWSDVLHTMNAASHVTAECLAPALDVMEQAWPEGEEHMAKLAVNSMIGLMAHDSNKAYTLRSSSNELDATGADTRQVFYVGEGRYVWDFITTRSIHNNGTLRPIHDCVLGFEATMVAHIRRELGLPPKYIKQVKTDCVVRSSETTWSGSSTTRTQTVSPNSATKRRRSRCEASTRRPVCRRSRQQGPPAGRTWPTLWRTAWQDAPGADHRDQAVGAGEVVHLISKTHSAVQNLGAGAKTADHWVRKYVWGASVQRLDWLLVEEVTQFDMGLWADIARVSLNHDVRFLLVGDFRQLPVLDTWAGTFVNKPLRHSQLMLDLAGGWRHELTENKRSDARIDGATALSAQARRAGHHTHDQPRPADGGQRGREPSPGPGERAARGARRRPGHRRTKQVATHARVAGPEAHRSGRSHHRTGERRRAHPARALKPDAPCPRAHLRVKPGPDAPRQGTPGHAL